jgi:uncharacterized protein YdaU (DUF1376 family)
MPFYIGDYMRNTAHLTTEQHGAYLLLIFHCWEYGKLPETAKGRASIAKLSANRWKFVGPVVEKFFRPDGTHKRVDEEREKADRTSMQRRISGQKGGMHSAITRAHNERFSNGSGASKRPSKNQAFASDLLQPPDRNHKDKITTSEYKTARTREAQGNDPSTASPAAPQQSGIQPKALASPNLEANLRARGWTR